MDSSVLDAISASDVSEAAPQDASVTKGLHVVGSAIYDGANPVKIAGVNRSGTEYSCIQNLGFFDGPSDANSINNIKAWHANTIRIPMNEDCWLAINGAPAMYSGSSYQKAIRDYVDLVVAAGLYVILDLHWTAPGTTSAQSQQPMPDADHSPTFWAQVAAAYKDDPSVILELFNEPYPDNNQDTTAAWTCWKSGGSGCSGVGYNAAGMQSLLDSVRGAGAPNLVLLGGVQYSNALSQWVTYKPTDSLDNIAAAWHVYDYNTCKTTTCYDNTAGNVVKSYPIVATEIGEQDCAGGFITTLMGWLDGKQQGYLGWTWDTWGGCLVLISDYNGTPAGTYGQTYKTHLLSL